MDKNSQIITDLRVKIGFKQSLDILSDWKGVPVVIKGTLLEIREKSILFRVEPPDSICLALENYALILHDVFIIGIQGRILAFDLQNGTVELGEFSYVDHGFGGRLSVRVEPDRPIEGQLLLDGTSLACTIVDISLNGFGILTQPAPGLAFDKGQAITLRLNLLDQEIEISGILLSVFPMDESIRLAMSFSQDAPGHAVIAHYISRRRAEIRQQIQTAYQEALENKI